MNPEQIKSFCADNDIRFVDVKFVDLFGLWQHLTRPIHELNDWTEYERSPWRQGYGFDGSSIRGFQKIEESDMLLVPDPETAIVDPAISTPTLSVICNVEDPVTRQRYSRDPRYVATKAEQYVKDAGIGDTVYIGPELEFFIFDQVSFDSNQHSAFYSIDSDEGIWNTGVDTKLDGSLNTGYRLRYKEGYFPVSPHDTQTDIRNEMVETMEACGIQIELHHHEVATAGQAEIDMRFDTLRKMADKAMLYKYIVKNVAKRHGKVATFMPKPIFQDNGSGMHTHLSIWKGGENLFFDEAGYALTSKMCRSYIAGLIKHGRALMALCAPTTNSYKRLVPGYEAPVNLVYSARNRSAACRIPLVSPLARFQARRISPAGPDGEPVPRLLGDPHGRPRRHRERTRPGPAAGQDEPLRPFARRAFEGAHRGQVAGGIAAGARSGPRLSPEGRRVHSGPARNVAGMEVRERSGPGAHAPPPVRVSPLLRRLSHQANGRLGGAPAAPLPCVRRLPPMAASPSPGRRRSVNVSAEISHVAAGGTTVPGGSTRVATRPPSFEEGATGSPRWRSVDVA